MEIYQVERQRAPGKKMIGYGRKYTSVKDAIAHANRAAETNSKAMQYGRYVVHNLAREEVYVVVTEPLCTPLWSTKVEED